VLLSGILILPIHCLFLSLHSILCTGGGGFRGKILERSKEWAK